MATDRNILKSSQLLENFPVLDTSLDDDPNFRRQLNKWSQKTEKVIYQLYVIIIYVSGTAYILVGVQPTRCSG